jgi:hypothetical protein
MLPPSALEQASAIGVQFPLIIRLTIDGQDQFAAHSAVENFDGNGIFCFSPL